MCKFNLIGLIFSPKFHAIQSIISDFLFYLVDSLWTTLFKLIKGYISRICDDRWRL